LLKAKAFFFERYRLNNIPAEYLVTGFHIGKVEIGKGIAEHGKKLIADAVPEKKNTVRITSHKAAVRLPYCGIR